MSREVLKKLRCDWLVFRILGYSHERSVVMGWDANGEDDESVAGIIKILGDFFPKRSTLKQSLN